MPNLNNTMNTYEIVSGPTPNDLAKLVREKIKDGFRPYGNPFVDPSTMNYKFNQAVIK